MNMSKNFKRRKGESYGIERIVRVILIVKAAFSFSVSR